MKNKLKKTAKKTFKDFYQKLISFHWFDELYERYMQNDKMIKWLSLFIVGFIYITTEFINPISWNYAEDVRGKALTVIYDTEKYVVEGLPKTVDFTLEGKEAVVKSLVNTNTFSAFVDLSQLKPGQHIVNVDYDVIPSSVKVVSNPKNISVLIKELKMINKEVSLEYYNQELLDPLIELGNPKLSQNTVEVKGAKDKVEQVVAVKGMVDVSDTSKLTEVPVELFAVDSHGNKLDVSIAPSSINVSIEASKPQKEILLDTRFMDEFPKGKLLKTLEIIPSKVTAFAPASKLDLLNVLFIDIKASEIKESGVYTFELAVPEGVTTLSETSVDVKIELEDESTRVLKDVPVQVAGLKEGLKVATALTTDITLIGLKDVISGIDTSQIKLSVDVSELGVGEHHVAIKVEKATTANVKVEKPETIQVKLEK